jgi:hypothetical protein
MGMPNNPDATRFQVNVPLSREALNLIDDARLPLRLSRSAFAKQALVAYVEQVSKKVA